MFYQDDPKKCTAAKMVKFGLAKNIKKIGSKGLVLDPFSEKTLLPKDKSVINSIVGIDCSLNLADHAFSQKFNGIKRKLPPLFAGNPVNYSKLNKLTTADCLISESTRKPGQIFEVVQIDGLNLNVRYSGSDVRLEKFSISPVSSDEFLPNANWNVEVIKTDEISRLYYKITYKTLE